MAARHHDLPGRVFGEWHLILAFITLTLMPTILLFLFAQKHIVAGLTPAR